MKLRSSQSSCAIRCSFVLAATSFLPLLQAQNSDTDPSILQKRYEAAQNFLAAHDRISAAEQYRIFIADALGETAIGRARAGQYDNAEDDFDEALTLVPDFPLMKLEYARAALRSGHIERAESLAKALIEQYPANAKVAPAAHAVLGRVLLKLNKDTEAKAQFEAAVALDPTFENGYELAVAELDLGDEAGASKIFLEMLTSFGDTAEIRMYFGQAYGNSDFQAKAIEEIKQALAKDDHLPGAHYSLAAAYLATFGNAKSHEAEEELRKEIAISPDDALAYAALGHRLVSQQDDPSRSAEGKALLERAAALSPDTPDAFLYLGQFYVESGNAASAEPALRKAIALTTDVSRNGFQIQQAHYLLGRLLIQQGHEEEGKQELAIATQLRKQNLARDQSRLSDYLEDKQSATTETDAAKPFMPMAVDRETIDRNAAAKVDAFERKITPAIADSYNNLGAISGSLGDYPSALVYFRHAATWQPSLEGLDLNWGRAAFETASYSEAIGPLSRYLSLHPDEANARSWLGQSEFMLKDYPDAILNLQKALALKPNDTDLQQTLAAALKAQPKSR
jgi:tetratricopeptide (TPR) repeat protein